MIGAGYEDGIDADPLRSDPMFKMALDLTPSDCELCSQSTISRLENLPDVRALLRMGRAMVDLYCELFAEVPKRITLDIDDTFDAVHGGQQLRLFNGYYDEYGFQPIVVFDGEGRFFAAGFVPPERPNGAEIPLFLRRPLRTMRASWPSIEILPRVDSHYCCPEVLIAVALTALTILASRRLRRCASCRPPGSRCEGALRGGSARRQASPLQGVLRWHAKLEPRRADRRSHGVRARKADTRFIVTNWKPACPPALPGPLLRRGRAENHIQSWSTPGRPTARPARRRPPTSSGSSCMPALTGSCGAFACRCRFARSGVIVQFKKSRWRSLRSPPRELSKLKPPRIFACTCRPRARPRIFCASLCSAYPASSPERRGARPQDHSQSPFNLKTASTKTQAESPSRTKTRPNFSRTSHSPPKLC